LLKKWRDFVINWLPVAMAGYACCALIAVLTGNHPNDLIVTIFSGAWGSAASAAATLNKVPPLLLTGLAVSIAFRVGLLNIGCEGQLTLGALATALAAQNDWGLPFPLQLFLSLACGALVGALWAAPAIWLRHRRGVHEVISTLLLNYLAIYLADYLARGPFGDGSAMGRTAEISPAAVMSPLFSVGPTGLSPAPLLALVLAFMAWIWFKRTVWGFEARTVGVNPEAAAGAGIPVRTWQWRLFLTSGALAGLAGGIEIVAVLERYYAAFSPGYGYDGITVAFLAAANPGWLWGSALLLASLRATDKWLQLALGVSPNAVFVIEAVLLLTVACQAALGAWMEQALDRAAAVFRTETGPS
jgi:ABC-type uncharacterized transport system permease subunit